MATRNIALYAGTALRPQDIAKNSPAVKSAGCTTIILGMLHIGNPAVRKDTGLGDIIFNNNDPFVIRGGKYVADSAWPDQIEQLKVPDSQVTQIYASCGGGQGVHDFETIRWIYNNNNHSFEKTQLKENFQVFRDTFPAITGIDMDCEDCYPHTLIRSLLQHADRPEI